MTVTLTAVEANYQQTKDGWGLLRLDSVDQLVTFIREKRRGSMRVEDFFEAWHQNGKPVKGKIVFGTGKKPHTIFVHLRLTHFDPLQDELTLVMRPIDSKSQIPSKMESVELFFFIDPDDRAFWDKWMGL